jgi:hypothetical protein
MQGIHVLPRRPARHPELRRRCGGYELATLSVGVYYEPRVTAQEGLDEGGGPGVAA